MRILHLIDSYGLYGAEKVALDLVRHQTQQGWSSQLGSIRRPSETERPFERAARDQGVEIVRFPMARGANLFGGMRVMNFAREHHVDLIHSHSYKGNIVVGLLPRNLRAAPLLMTLHGWRPPRTTVARCIQRLETTAIYRADHVVAVHQTLVTDPRLTALPRSRLNVIRNGIPASPAEPVDRKVAQRINSIITGKFAVAAVGRLSAEKGFDLLLKSVANLRDRDVDCKLVIFGDGEERSDLEKRTTDLQLQSHVHFFGYVVGASNYLNSFDCLAIPSRAEGCPLVALEGMRAGVPVVASKAGGLPGILKNGRCGRLVAIGDSDGLADALFDVHENFESTKSHVLTATRNVSSSYQAQEMSRSYAELYMQISASNESTSSARQTFGRSQNATSQIIPQDS